MKKYSDRNKLDEAKVNEATGAVIIDHKNKKYINVSKSNWSKFDKPIQDLKGAIEGTGDGDLEISIGQPALAEIDDLKNDGYKESKNMTLSIELI